MVELVLWVGVGLVVLVGFVAIFQFNRMVALRNRCAESWSNVDTELRRRYELIPNLVATVKGHAKHEQDVLATVVQARAAALASTGRPAEQARDENTLVRAIDRLLAVAEAYPQLKASKNFLQLQDELAITEDRIQAARRFYNANVRDYRNQTRQFPGVVFAGLYRMPEIDFFEIDSPHMRSAPQVSMPALARGT